MARTLIVISFNAIELSRLTLCILNHRKVFVSFCCSSINSRNSDPLGTPRLVRSRSSRPNMFNDGESITISSDSEGSESATDSKQKQSYVCDLFRYFIVTHLIGVFGSVDV